MTPKEATAVVRYLAAVYRVKVEPAEMAAWVEQLRPMRAQAVQLAARELVASPRDFMPRPGQVLDAARRIGNRLALQEADDKRKAEQRALPVGRAEASGVRRLIDETRAKLASTPSPTLRFAAARRPPDDGFHLPPSCGAEDHSKCGGGPTGRRAGGGRAKKEKRQP